jgi:hypothetical protein
VAAWACSAVAATCRCAVMLTAVFAAMTWTHQMAHVCLPPQGF